MNAQTERTAKDQDLTPVLKLKRQSMSEILMKYRIWRRNIRTPFVHETKEVLKCSCESSSDDGFVPARPLSCQYSPSVIQLIVSIKYRLCVAYKVFTGKYDALKWSGYDD